MGFFVMIIVHLTTISPIFKGSYHFPGENVSTDRCSETAPFLFQEVISRKYGKYLYQLPIIMIKAVYYHNDFVSTSKRDNNTRVRETVCY